MNLAIEKTVRQLALENTAATRVFEKLGIDYCCGGNKSLAEACRAAKLNIDQVLDSLEVAEQSTRAAQTVRNWQIEPLADLIAHIKGLITNTRAKRSPVCVHSTRKCVTFMAKIIPNYSNP